MCLGCICKATSILALAVCLAPWAAGGQLQVFGQSKSEGALAQNMRRPVLRGVAPDPDDSYFEKIYANFYSSYRLGPGDEIAVRVLRQPDYSLEKTRITPVGEIYHPLLGDMRAAGYTVAQLSARLTGILREYLIEPRVSVALLEAQSAKVAVLGEVERAGIFVLDRPMTLLDAISAAGGFTPAGKQSKVSLLRHNGSGAGQVVEVNVKRILEGKAGPEENPFVRPGDTVIVHNKVKSWLSNTASFVRFTSLLAFLVVR